MKCETCQELLSEFIDDQLDEKAVARVKAHLTLCAKCAEIYQDFSNILGVCDLDLAEEIPPPNEQALWCRINNIIEAEVKPEVVAEQNLKPVSGDWFSKMWRRSWSLSLTQLTTAIVGIALISSLLTVVGLRNSNPFNENNSDASMQPSLFEKVLGKVGLVETPQQARERRLREQQAAIDYWNKRVEARRAQWDNHLREVFDRNLNEVDQVVTGYNRALEENPQDELSNEMLDSAMTEKVELLREFSDL
ncbi:MAG: anti-sigma factor family protein [Pyrinomonadaceae bacterium]